MKTSAHRIFKALCAITALAMLTACGGATSTVDPFTPDRVIGLGDGYNDVGSSGYTAMRDPGNPSTVVEQVAYRFGLASYLATYGATIAATGTYSLAVANSKINDGSSLDLKSQITNLLGTVTSFTDKDLIVLTVGTQDIMATTPTSTATASLKTQLKRLLDANARHILIMQPLEVMYTPYGRANPNFTGKTLEFVNGTTSIEGELTTLASLIRDGGYSKNPIIFTNVTPLSSNFNIFTNANINPAADFLYSVFSTSTRVSYCSNGVSTSDASTAGCTISSGFNDGTYATRLFADGIHFTPAGNRWAGDMVYDATAQGWR